MEMIKADQRCNLETGDKCICNQRAGCPLFWPPKATEFPMFAHYRNDKFDHIFPSEGQVRLCGDGEVISVNVRLAADGENSSHWGWVGAGKEKPTMIWPNYLQLCVCFQSEDGMLNAIRRGMGRPVRLNVERKE